MTISIVLPEGKGLKIGAGTKVLSGNKVEISDVTKIIIAISADNFIYATIEVAVDKIENMENIHALLGTKTLKEIGKLHSVNMDLSEFDTTALLAEIISRKQIHNAPVKTTRTPEHKEVIVGIGNDDVANIIIHDDALLELNKLTGN